MVLILTRGLNTKKPWSGSVFFIFDLGSSTILSSAKKTRVLFSVRS